MQVLHVQYDYKLVAASVLISIVAAYTAFSLAERMRTAQRQRRRWWLLGGSFAMGIGVWSMHFLGMLAAEIPADVYYFVPTVVLSALLAIAASAVVLTLVAAEHQGRRTIFVGGILMGAGIGGMHYTGMAAMRSSAMHHYNPWIVALSIAVAVSFSWLSLRTGFVLRENEGSRITAAVLMGLGIASMHYVAMVGITFTAMDKPFSTAWTVPNDTLGAVAVIVTTALVLIVALATARVDKARFRRLSEAHQKLAAAQSALLESQDQLKEANALLSELSIRDGLTGLYNRRHFDAVLGTEWRRAVRSKAPLSLLMLDVDCFKNLNDRYGHQRGDDCLREIARVLEELPRRGYDTAARYGGEEFAVLLPEADHAGALMVAEAIRLAVLRLKIENEGSLACDYLTVSVGVCTRYPRIHEESEVLVRDADTALYGAKQLGRNRVETCTDINVNA